MRSTCFVTLQKENTPVSCSDCLWVHGELRNGNLMNMHHGWGIPGLAQLGMGWETGGPKPLLTHLSHIHVVRVGAFNCF